MNDWEKKDLHSRTKENNTDDIVLLLSADRDHVREVTNLEEYPLLAEKVNAVMLKGIEQGQKRTIRIGVKRKGLQAVVILISMLLLLTAFARISPTFATILKDIPGFGRFVELIGDDFELQSAIENEYFQVVNKSDERNGYTFTVNGVLADAKRIVILYTAAGPGINEENMTMLPFELSDEHGGNINSLIAFAHYGLDDTKRDSQGKLQDYLDIVLAPGVDVPQVIQFKLKAGGEWLVVEVPIDQSRFAEMTEVIPINQVIEIDGLRVEVTEAVITPLQVSVNFKTDPNHAKRMNGFVELELVDERGRVYKESSGMGDLNGEFVRHFQSSSIDKPKSLTLRAKGLLVSERGLEVVIDTEKEILLNAPDDRLQLISVRKSADAVDLAFELSHEDDPPEVNRAIVLFGYSTGKGQVKDAAGNVYRVEGGMSDGNTSSQFRAGSRLFTYYYNIPNADFAQPLTFDVDMYLGHVMQDIVIPIK
ncbi:DUF4179 domain-containing protein [Paenibacillus sp. strain BS8-2]